MERSLQESVWQRARRDTLSAFHTLRFWFFEVCTLTGVTVWVLLWTPSWAKDGGKIVYQILVPLAGVFAGLAIVFLVSLFVAPYRQRNEVRTALRAIPGATPSTLKSPYPPEIHVSYQKHEFGVDNGVPIITVWAEYRPTGPMRVEAIELHLVGKRIPSLDWKVLQMSQDLWCISDNKFKLLARISPGEHDAKLAAFANGEWWGSDPFTITFPEASS